MAKKATTLLISLDENSQTPLYQQLYKQMQNAMFSGVLLEGERLPSIRALSRDLSISHTTVEKAYLQLAVEGFVHSLPRSGYVVVRLDTDFLKPHHIDNAPEIAKIKAERNQDAFYNENAQGEQARFDFSYANLPTDSFPVGTWRKIANELLFAKTEPRFARYESVDEPNVFRSEISHHLARARGVNCTPDQVIVQAGTDGALNTVMQLFDRNNCIIGMEEPGYATAQEVCARNGFSLAPITTDAGIEEYFDAIEKTRPHIIFTTPSHQFPTGRVFPVDARTRLLKWAKQNNAYIIEDDSCNEYRYDTRPIPSLQSLDTFNRVIYLCNFSKALSPSLRISYLVLPPILLSRYLELFSASHPPVSWLDQELLARFIAEGHWDAHIRKMSQQMKKRHDILLTNLRNTMGDQIDIQGINAGMHFYVTVHNEMSQEDLISSALKQGAKVYGTRRMWFANPAPENNVMLGFSAMNPSDFESGVKALHRAWFA